MVTETKKTDKDAIDVIIANIEKQMGHKGKSRIFRMKDKPEIEDGVKAISTGIAEIDDASFCGGVCEGKIVELFGPESSGKSYVSLHIIASAQKGGRLACLMDVEQSLDLKWAKKQGVNVDDLLIMNDSLTAEEYLNYVNTMAQSGKFGVIVIDSTASLIPKAELEGEIGDQNVALLARAMSQGLKKIVSSTAIGKTAVIFINQLRDKPGTGGRVFMDSSTTPGGRALKFYAHQRIEVFPGAQIKVEVDGEEEVIGRTSYIKFVKNKVARPFGKCTIDIIWNEGMASPSVKIVMLAKEMGVISKYKGEMRISKEVMGTSSNHPTGTKDYVELADFLKKNDLLTKIVEATIEKYMVLDVKVPDVLESYNPEEHVWVEPEEVE